MAKGKVLQTVIDIAGEISPTLGKSLDKVTDKLEGVNVKAMAAGAAVGAIAIGTVKAVTESVKYLAELGDAYNSAVNDISAGTGLVGAELEGMGDVLKDVYGSNFGESMEDAAAGINEVYRATGLTGDALAETTKGAYALADTFGYDVAESARAAKAMMTNFGVTGEEAMGLIAAGAQNGLDYSGELIDTISEYSVQFSKLGFSADEMFSVLQQGADSGAWNLDKVGDAVKEFSIRSIDGSKTTKEAFTDLGFDADSMMAIFAEGGYKAQAAFKGVLAELMEMDDEVKRDAIGVSLFGTQWEDLGTEAMTALLDMESGAYNAEDALGKINDVKYNNLTDAFEGIKRQAEVSLLPLASTIAKAFTQIAPVIGKLFEKLGPIIEQVTAEAMPFVTEFLDGMMVTLDSVIPLVLELASAILPVLSSFVKQLLPPLLSLINQLLPPLMELVMAILPPLSAILLAILPMLTTILSAVLPVLISLMNTLLPILTPILELATSLLNDVVMPLLEPIMQLVNALLPAIAPILELIISGLQPVFDLLGPLADVLGIVVGWIAKVVGWVADGLSWVVDLIFGDTSGQVSEAASANGYATGGFTNGLSIAGEDPRYPTEAVISFNPAYRAQNLSYWAQAGRMLGAEASDFYLGGGGSGGTVIDIGGISFAPNITITGTASKQTIMDAIEAEYPEFIDMLEEYLVNRGATVYG
jgi:TP901 family phage tail tape measure protein